MCSIYGEACTKTDAREIVEMSNHNLTYPSRNPQWFALMVRSRSEQMVSDQLTQRGFSVMFPSRLERRRMHDRVKSVRKALFPGYTFCRFATEERLSVITTPGVNSVVGNGKEALPISDSEVSSLEHLIRSQREVKEVPYIAVGQRVEIVEGALRGVQGIVSAAAKNQLVLSISALGRSVAVRLDEEAIRPV
jgi:transcription antitermination factor NusG